MYQTLYRKYRPRSFSDVCGQERITTVLRRQVEDGTFTHAYLFCGTRGTGKTTCAKILAKVVNCLNPQGGEPCNECANCIAADRGELLDVLEVDAASNTGVENIRRLCEELNFLPSQGKRRVYIIDEVHMLSTGAFNALLKTLEEPPSHAMFILATTELHKVLPTVRSRCQCFTFHRLSIDDIAARILYVSKQENIPLSQEGARLIARLSDGAMRDALSLLELCVGQEGPLDEELLDRLFGLGDGEAILDLVSASLNGDSARCMTRLDELYQSLGDLKEIVSQVLAAYRDMLLFHVGMKFETTSNRTARQQEELNRLSQNASVERLLYAVGQLEEALVRFDRLSVNKKTVCEIAFLRICTPSLTEQYDSVLARLSALEQRLENGAISVSAPSEKKKEESALPVKEDSVPWKEETMNTPASEKKADSTPKKTVTKSKSEPSLNNGACPYADALLQKLGAQDPLFSSFCAGLVLVEADGVLWVYGQAFTVTMLEAREKEILALAREFSPALTAVRFSEGQPKPASSKQSDLGGF